MFWFIKEGGGSDTEEEDEKLQELEGVLRHHNPEFLGDTSSNKPLTVAENYQLPLSTEQVNIFIIIFLFCNYL